MNYLNFSENLYCATAFKNQVNQYTLFFLPYGKVYRLDRVSSLWILWFYIRQVGKKVRYVHRNPTILFSSPLEYASLDNCDLKTSELLSNYPFSEGFVLLVAKLLVLSVAALFFFCFNLISILQIYSMGFCALSYVCYVSLYKDTLYIKLSTIRVHRLDFIQFPSVSSVISACKPTVTLFDYLIILGAGC